MKHILSVFAMCLVLALISCGKDGETCSADYIGTWSGDINCTGSGGAPITVVISEMMGDTLSVSSNGELLQGVLDGCDLNLIPTDIDQPPFGMITITGSFSFIGDDLVFMQMRSSGGVDETCTFTGKK